MRTLRHPGVIRVLDTVETETYIYVATERVTPLAWPVRRKSISEESSKWGLFTVANTLAFLNDEAASIHGNIRLSSIYMSQSGEWRIGGFEVLSSVKDDDAVIYRYGGLVPEFTNYFPPEVSKNGWDILKRNPASAMDSYGYGILIFEVLNGNFLNNEQVGQVKGIPSRMQQSYKRLLNANPKARLSVSHFRDQGRRDGGFFETPLIKLSEGIESLGLKDDAERADFLKELDEVADDFPEEYFSVKVLPELLKSVEFGGGGPQVFASVMKIGRKLSDEEWDTKLTPVVVRLFSNPDRAIRVCLLDNLPNMIDQLPQKIVNDKIFPQMVTGFSDVAPLVREQTVKAVLTIVNKLADRTINGELLKQLAKTSNDDQPGIRTNTTICMGKIARNLGTNTRQKVLVAAFSRALRDPFVHARNAALLALAATADLFSDEDCATKILPSVCPSLVDKEKLVRDTANRTFDVFVQRIRKFATSLPDTVLPPPTTTAAGNAAPRMGTPQNDAAGWAGWAISSFTNKISAANGDIQTTQPPPLLRATKSERPSSVPPKTQLLMKTAGAGAGGSSHYQAFKDSTHSSTKPTTPRAALAASTLSRTHSDSLLADTTTENNDDDDNNYDDADFANAWGDFDDEDNDKNDDTDADIDTAFDAPLTSTTQHSRTNPIAFDDGGEPDFEGWLKAQAQASRGSGSKTRATKSSTAAAAAASSSRPSTRINGQAKPTTTTTTSATRSTVQPSRPTTTTTKKAIDTKPKDGPGHGNDGNDGGDDDWGDAWD